MGMQQTGQDFFLKVVIDVHGYLFMGVDRSI
jgi:hypothetical protein